MLFIVSILIDAKFSFQFHVSFLEVSLWQPSGLSSQSGPVLLQEHIWGFPRTSFFHHLRSPSVQLIFCVLAPIPGSHTSLFLGLILYFGEIHLSVAF